MKAFESAQADLILERLQEFAAQFLDSRREEQVVRRLCVFLGYLSTAAVDV